MAMPQLDVLRAILPSLKIEGSFESLDITIDVKDIGEQIVNQIKSAGYEASYEVKDNKIIVKVVLFRRRT